MCRLSKIRFKKQIALKFLINLQTIDFKIQKASIQTLQGLFSNLRNINDV
jgi:hypothetical protein